MGQLLQGGTDEPRIQPPPNYPRYLDPDDATVDWSQLHLLLRNYIFHIPRNDQEPLLDLPDHNPRKRVLYSPLILDYRALRS